MESFVDVGFFLECFGVYWFEEYIDNLFGYVDGEDVCKFDFCFWGFVECVEIEIDLCIGMKNYIVNESGCYVISVGYLWYSFVCLIYFGWFYIFGLSGKGKDEDFCEVLCCFG